MKSDLKESVIVVGPQGCGKSFNAEKIRQHFGLSYVCDEDTTSPIPSHDVLFLTNGDVPKGSKVKVVQYAELVKSGVVPDRSKGKV